MDAGWMRLSRWTGGRAVLIAVAALPFAAALGFRCVPHTPQQAADSPSRPALVFDQYFVNLSEMHNTARVEALFHFKNCGKSPARITNLEPSCGCLNPKLEKRAYLPGEDCEFSLNVLTTRERPGPHDYELKIDYEDPEPRSVTVAFKIVVRREVTVRPSQLLFYQNGSQEAQRTILVTDMRPKPFRVTGATCKSPSVKVSLGQPIDDPDGGRETAVVITVAAQVPAKGEQATVFLSTDDPRYPRIPIPVWIRDIRMSTIQPASGARPAAASNPGP